MKQTNEYEKDLATIRSMMERSVKFLSLSGLSGVLAGTYALTGSAVGYFILYDPTSFDFQPNVTDEKSSVFKLVAVATLVLFASLLTGYGMSLRKAKKIGMPIWNPASRQLLIDLVIPLVTGGILIVILQSQGYVGLVAPVSLIFYGMALIQGGRNTFDEIKYLGITEITIGFASALNPSLGLIFWALGFGVMHIIYGAVMYFRYDQ